MPFLWPAGKMFVSAEEQQSNLKAQKLIGHIFCAEGIKFHVANLPSSATCRSFIT